MEGLIFGILRYIHSLSGHSFKFLWTTVNSKPPTVPFRIVACSFSDNLSQNSCILYTASIEIISTAAWDS